MNVLCLTLLRLNTETHQNVQLSVQQIFDQFQVQNVRVWFTSEMTLQE